MSESAVMVLCLDAPLQSWGVSSRFQRRQTLPYPTRSGIAGMICAAAGAAKGSTLEEEVLQQVLPEIRLTVFELPKQGAPVRRLIDFHTVLGTRRASGAENPDPVVTRREYLLDARFGVLLEGPAEKLKRIQSWLENPRWGVWFGRKCCLPAAPICRGIFPTREQAVTQLSEGRGIEEFTRVEEAGSFEDGTDTLMDSPVSFGRPDSSCEGRLFAPRRVRLSMPERA
ncbi:MAG: type I-E CRISPR-associated protein Cas5/CasD [Halothiobacillaceae bacterium]